MATIADLKRAMIEARAAWAAGRVDWATVVAATWAWRNARRKA